LPRKRFLIDLT